MALGCKRTGGPFTLNPTAHRGQLAVSKQSGHGQVDTDKPSSGLAGISEQIPLVEFTPCEKNHVWRASEMNSGTSI